MSRYERDFLNRHGDVGVLPLLEGWERLNSLKAGLLSTEQRWERFITMTDRCNDNSMRTLVAAAV